MTKTRFLTIAVALLIVVNFVLIGFILLKHNMHQQKGLKRGHRNNPKEQIIKRLDFSDQQIAEYENLITIHRSSIEEKEEDLRKVKIELYSLLSEDEYSNKDSLLLEISRIKTEIGTIHFNHFVDIKAICKTNQIEDFKKLTKDLTKIFNGPPPHGPPPRKNKHH